MVWYTYHGSYKYSKYQFLNLLVFILVLTSIGEIQTLNRRTTEKRNRMMWVPCLSAVRAEDLEHFMLMMTPMRVTFVTSVVIKMRTPTTAYRKAKTRSVRLSETKFTKHQESG